MNDNNAPVSKKDILDRLKLGELVPMDDPEYYKIREIVHRTLKISNRMNNCGDIDETRLHLSEIIGTPIDESTIVFPPFYTNFGRFINCGKKVFINHGCTFLDMGGITIEDNVLIGPKVNIITENHPSDPDKRHSMLTKPITIKKNVWIGANATILPGVTIGENAVVAAGAVVSKDVADNMVVGGVPARIIKRNI